MQAPQEHFSFLRSHFSEICRGFGSRCASFAKGASDRTMVNCLEANLQLAFCSVVLPVNEFFVTGLLIAREHVTFVSPHLNPSPRGRGTLKSYSPSPNGIRGWGMRAVPPLAFLDRLPIALLGTFSSRGCIPIRAIVGGSNGYRRGVGNSVSPLLF